MFFIGMVVAKKKLFKHIIIILVICYHRRELVIAFMHRGTNHITAAVVPHGENRDTDCQSSKDGF